MTFWEHLDELRGSLIKMVVAVVACAVISFFFKDELFDIILAPQDSGFITYRLLEQIAASLLPDGLSDVGAWDVQLINIGLARQFLLHVKASVCAGILLTSPYLIYLLFHFISPALYTHERKYAIRLVVSGYIMFMLGVLLSYYLIFPLIFRFLGTYQVSDVVANTVTIDSYMETLMTVSLSMGIVFEIPVICWVLGRMGFINAALMSHYRRHVIVVLLIIAAIITPTSDVFTLMLVALPMWLLYEVSILIVRSAPDLVDKKV
ncbi:MAG: twin-arginine translocase subunit TatC [Bacteroidaceae bacterium]|nr:twin-arginine translocase subunit TatC [Bacteroidaceae bacterium]